MNTQRCTYPQKNSNVKLDTVSIHYAKFATLTSTSTQRKFLKHLFLLSYLIILMKGKAPRQHRLHGKNIQIAKKSHICFCINHTVTLLQLQGNHQVMALTLLAACLSVCSLSCTLNCV